MKINYTTCDFALIIDEKYSNNGVQWCLINQLPDVMYWRIITRSRCNYEVNRWHLTLPTDKLALATRTPSQ